MGLDDNPQLWLDYISSDPTYRELKDLKDRGWSNEAGDAFFEKRRRDARDADEEGKERLYSMTKAVGNGLAEKTRLFTMPKSARGTMVLDLCMAPGGFTATAAKMLPKSHIDAVTLPPQVGGYEPLAKGFCENILYADITMFSKEMVDDEETISADHPDCNNFITSRPFLGSRYDIVLCGGAVGKDHPREEYRDYCEADRLLTSQLVFAMNRLKPGGSILVLLHRIESWNTVCILHAFSQFSDSIQLYKHDKIHAIKSSFYMVAKNVDLEHSAAKECMAYWKGLWKYQTFKNFDESIPLPQSSLHGTDDDHVRRLRDGFGPQFLRMAQPVWEIQANALRKAPFLQHA